ncbi:hypothetical protein ACJIZ3_025679 [Penstemon smallii]|uniref:Transmembrane protein n=1 Tax=Penstemon smallii TaxID=265156 RepID=A0ABD3TXI7_9LAMI
MASGQRLLMAVFFLLWLSILLVSSTTVRSFGTVKEPPELDRNFQHLDMKDIVDINDDDEVSNMERRMIMQLNDYPGAGANSNHEPKPHRKRV